MKELEVKVLGIDLEKIESKIISLGGKLISKEVQVNTLIDTKDNLLQNKKDSYLRIRETKSLLTGDIELTLTMKKNINRKDIRENIELNTNISDKKVMLEILENLGYYMLQEGFKERKSYILNDVRLDLDKWDDLTYPYPYMEIEVNNKEDLNNIIKLLDISKESISTKSIVELRKEANLL